MNYFELIYENIEVKTYLAQADENFKSLGYTEQGILHAHYTANITNKILSKLNFSLKDLDIAKTAAFLHDIGCAVSYNEHIRSSCFISKRILEKLKFPQEYIINILAIIGSHEDTTIIPISELAAAVILADKTDVRRQRVIKKDFKLFDKHDRVHYAVIENNLDILPQKNKIILNLTIDDEICSVLEYFEIFFSRIEFCRKAVAKLGFSFEFYINNVKYL